MTTEARATFTAGPWRAVADPDGSPWWEILADDDVIVANVWHDEPRAEILCPERAEAEANAQLIAKGPAMAKTLIWIRENLHPRALGRAATDAELLAITHATTVLREAGVIPTPVLQEAES